MATLQAIADLSGVSIRTVNRVLKGDGPVGTETRERVLAAATQLGYRPNLAARSLRTGRSHDVAVIVRSLDELHTTKLAAFEQAMREADFVTHVLFDLAGTGAISPDILERARMMRPAGLALFPALPPDAASAAPLPDQGDLPSVVVDAPVRAGKKKDRRCQVQLDRQAGVREAVLHLASRGYRRIAYLGERDDSRVDGYRRGMTDAGLSPMLIETHVGNNPSGLRHPAESTDRLLAGRPEAVQCYSDVVALQLLHELHTRGVRVPEDLAVVGFDDRPAARLTWPALTTVAQPNREVGQAAAELLLARIRGEKRPQREWTRRLATSLVVREST